eukprot:6213059-Pleurochrysis_carterae.AAC.7
MECSALCARAGALAEPTAVTRQVATASSGEHGVHSCEICNAGHVVHGGHLAAADGPLDGAHSGEVADEVELEVDVHCGARSRPKDQRDRRSVLRDQVLNEWEVLR